MYGKILKNYFENITNFFKFTENQDVSEVRFDATNVTENQNVSEVRFDATNITEKQNVLEVRFDATNVIKKYSTSSKYKDFRYESELTCDHVAKDLNKALNKEKFKSVPIIRTEYHGPHDFGASEEKILIGCNIIYSD